MSQPPPGDPGQSSNQGQLPSWPSGDQPPSWPSSGQPPSWPSTGADQGQPPPWPPGGQPPCPGPGYTYGYGPQPPRFRRRYRFRGARALVTLGLFIAFGIVVRSITASHDSVSTTPFPSASGVPATGTQAPPGKIGSYFDLRDDRGNVYRLTLVKVIDPAQPASQFNSPDSGERLVGVVFSIKALTGSPQDEDANNDAVLVGGNGQHYQADFDTIAGYANFDSGTIHVAQGDTVTGAVTFQVPDGGKISKVQWDTLSGFGSTVEWNVPG
jgi:hypothetical protein